MGNKLTVIDGGTEHGYLYFFGKLEVSEPLLVTPPFTTKRGLTVAAVASRGNKNYFFTQADIQGIKLTKTTSVPAWLANS